jgi:hypothetical protein
MGLSTVPSDEAELRRLLHELSPYAKDVLLIGGWVPTLYTRYGSEGAWATRPSRTLELDLALRGNGIEAERRPILADVLRSAGLVPDPGSQIEPTGSAVWVGDKATGAMIEFLMPPRGPYHTIARPHAVAGQPGLAAVPLEGLELLWRATCWLRLPGTMKILVQVPTLGIYVLNKATTFPKRVPRNGERNNPKQGKDLIYLHDCALAGRAIVQSIERDIADGREQDAAQQLGTPLVRHAVDKAISNLEFVQQGNFSEAVQGAVEQLAERERISTTAARASLDGAIRDLREILEPFRAP